MGWRSIRLSFEHPDIFLQQIRAILRAAHDTEREIRLLFPMITVGEELVQIQEFVNQARDNLRAAGEPFGTVKLGMMLEVPAAAVMIEELLELVDFVSIGTNDLVQYLTAADRDNPKVSHLCQALSPAVLRVLCHVISACRRADKHVSLCGELAGSPRAFPLLLGMGLRSFSMSSSFIPAIHDFATHLSIPEAETILAQTLVLKTSKDIHRLMDDVVLHLRPELNPLLIA
jgi:phosphotransferase system enzyme I (PtsI)